MYICVCMYIYVCMYVCVCIYIFDACAFGWLCIDDDWREFGDAD